MSSTQGTRRTNDEWLSALRAPEGPLGREAHAELRALVQAVLRKAVARGEEASLEGPDDATLDDLTQVATLQVLSKLDRFEGRSQFTTWAYSVAVRAAVSELRKAGRHAAGRAPATAALDVPADGSREPDQVSERDEIFAILHRVIEEDLTERQRTAVLAELRGTPQAEVLETLGINRNALYKLLHDARRKLHDGLCAAGICDDEVRESFGL